MRDTERKPRRAFACLFSGFLALVLFSCSLCAVRSPPSWWKAGRPRRRPGSLAEAELLSHLAVLLLPEEPIEELFRDFPAEKGEGWGSNTLSPNLALYGALESDESALFVEYDGYYRHQQPVGIAADSRKNTALLDLAPAGSYVLRIAHAHRGLEVSCQMGEVVVDSWQPGHDASLVKALLQVAEFLLTQREITMHPDRRAKLQKFVEDPAGSSGQAAFEFTEQVAAERKRDFDPARLQGFLQMQLGVSISEAEVLLAKCPALARYDIDDKLKPMMQQLEKWGLKTSQVAKVFCSISTTVATQHRRELEAHGAVAARCGPDASRGCQSDCTLSASFVTQHRGELEAHGPMAARCGSDESRGYQSDCTTAEHFGVQHRGELEAHGPVAARPGFDQSRGCQGGCTLSASFVTQHRGELEAHGQMAAKPGFDEG